MGGSYCREGARGPAPIRLKRKEQSMQKIAARVVPRDLEAPWKPAQLIKAVIFHDDPRRKVDFAEAGEKEIVAFLRSVDVPQAGGDDVNASELFSVKVEYGREPRSAREAETVTFSLAPNRAAWHKSHKAVRDGLSGEGPVEASPGMPLSMTLGLHAMRVLGRIVPKAAREELIEETAKRELAAHAMAQIADVTALWSEQRHWIPLLKMGIAMSDQSTRDQWDPDGFYGGPGKDAEKSEAIGVDEADGAERELAGKPNIGEFRARREGQGLPNTDREKQKKPGQGR
jgi:hypothetical protein